MSIVADEVFLDYTGLCGTKPAQTFALHDAALTFTAQRASKFPCSAQMKLAWTVVSGPDAAVRAAVDRLEIIADTYLSPGTPVQLALPKFLSLRHSMQEQVQQRIRANLAVPGRHVARFKFCPAP